MSKPKPPLFPRRKVCLICAKCKPVASFAWLSKAGQRHSYCKPCLSEYMLSRYHATKKQ